MSPATTAKRLAEGTQKRNLLHLQESLRKINVSFHKLIPVDPGKSTVHMETPEEQRWMPPLTELDKVAIRPTQLESGI